jgi:protein-tyrosine phosphatase
MKILFVCLGNICRSPVAEAVCRKQIEEKKLTKIFHAESRGTSDWEQGNGAHPKTRVNARENGIDLEAHISQQVTADDLETFDVIVALDRSNFRDLKHLGAHEKSRLVLLREFDPEGDENNLDVPDPFYHGGFQGVFDMVSRCVSQLLDQLDDELKKTK